MARGGPFLGRRRQLFFSQKLKKKGQGGHAEKRIEKLAFSRQTPPSPFLLQGYAWPIWADEYARPLIFMLDKPKRL